MNPYFLVPLVACLVCLGCGVLILSREPDETTHRCAAGLLLGATFWAACETLWTLSSDPERVLMLVRLSSLGFVFVGPIALQLFLAQIHPRPALHRAVPWCYALAGLALVAEWTGDSMHRAVLPKPWGRSYEVGPAFAVWYAFTLAVACAGIVWGFLRALRSTAPAERAQTWWLGVGVGLPLLLGSVSDGLLPVLGVHVPRLGVASFAALGVLTSWSLLRFGHSLMATGSFAGQVLADLPDGVAMTTPSGRIRFANRRFAELLGRDTEALLSCALDELIPDAPVDPPREEVERETELLRADGTPIPVALSTRLLHDKQRLLIGLVVVVRDLREVAELRRRLVVSGRLAAVGELAAGIAHEINNPLSFIGANLRLLGEHWGAVQSARGKDDFASIDGLLGEGEELILESIEGVDRATAIVRDVRVLAHGGGRDRELVDVNSVIEHALRVARSQLGEHVRIERALQPVPAIHAAPGEVEQVLLNLLLNSKSAVRAGGTIRVESVNETRHVVVVVRDDGTGIAPEILDRIFDPFFTTKPVGEGTGLGLAISHEIVRRHQGEMLVDSTPGEGTTFRVRLPVDPRTRD